MSKIEYLEYAAWENDFKGSTSILFKIEDDIVKDAVNTSTYETNYVWDKYFDKKEFIGMTKEKLEEWKEHAYDDFEDEFRRPYIRTSEESKEYWEHSKKQERKELKERVDPLEIKMQMMKMKVAKRSGANLGKTGDTKTGEISAAHRETASIQQETAKNIMSAHRIMFNKHRYGKGGK